MKVLYALVLGVIYWKMVMSTQTRKGYLNIAFLGIKLLCCVSAYIFSNFILNVVYDSIFAEGFVRENT